MPALVGVVGSDMSCIICAAPEEVKGIAMHEERKQWWVLIEPVP